MAARRALRQEISTSRPDVISSHFALYTFPGLDVTRGIPQVSHFQGPWADESHVEGADSLGQRAKRYLEQSVYARSSRLIVLSEAFGKILTSRYGSRRIACAWCRAASMSSSSICRSRRPRRV